MSLIGYLRLSVETAQEAVDTHQNAGPSPQKTGLDGLGWSDHCDFLVWTAERQVVIVG
jgi:hypothetical protein